MSKLITLLPSKTVFSVEENQTILEGALDSNIYLEYGCSDGRCGQCRALLLGGLISQSDSAENITLLPDELLTCCTQPITDITLKADYIMELNDIPRKNLPAKIFSLNFISEEVLILTLRLPANSRFIFLPGQYIDLMWKGSKRSYSIASSRTEGNRLDLHIKKVDGGLFSDILFNDVKINDLFHLHGPLGTFFVRDSSAPLMFLCTGTGFAPVKSMVEGLILSGNTRDIYIYWGGRYLDEL